MKRTAKIIGYVLPFVTVGIIFAVWAIVANSLKDEIVLPTVKDTVRETFAMFKEKEFYVAYFNTLLRTAISFLISFAAAFILAYFCYKSEYFKKAVNPIILIIRSFPTIAMVLWLALFVDSSVAPVIVTGFVVLPTLFSSLYGYLKEVDKNLIEMCSVFGVSKSDTLKKVILPPLIGKTTELCGAGISLNLKLMVAAETLAGAARAIGFLMKREKADFETAKLLALVLIVVLTAIIIETAFTFIAGRLKKWEQ